MSKRSRARMSGVPLNAVISSNGPKDTKNPTVKAYLALDRLIFEAVVFGAIAIVSAIFFGGSFLTGLAPVVFVLIHAYLGNDTRVYMKEDD